MSSTENSWVGKTPLLTVAIPVFNRGKSAAVIAEALAPQLRDADVEALIIDDGSSDGSWELLQEIQKIWPQLRMLRNVKIWAIRLPSPAVRKRLVGSGSHGDR